ncbi:serine/arginine-rich splicing factor SR45-like [Iris pallida]|uniref:Serine/arginine-rich splicing factor SR45-like n=1 Tax=Iris pallida TaxID=29817 RepID=A0AAX6FKY2_IRIPA|nr:serine/arginine-rich splicing factor SR45-like [Iris pallida]
MRKQRKRNRERHTSDRARRGSSEVARRCAGRGWRGGSGKDRRRRRAVAPRQAVAEERSHGRLIADRWWRRGVRHGLALRS